MNFNLVVPKHKASRTKKPGFGGDFWKKFWQEQITDETREHYQRVYKRRKGSIISNVKKITHRETGPKKLYALVKLDPKATAKSNCPDDLWVETGLEIVASKDDQTFVISGTAEEFKKLETVAENSNFDAAYTGANLERKKDKQIARELFAVSSVKDQNSVVEGRVSRVINEYLDNSINTPIECVIELYSNQLLTDYDTIFEKLNTDFPDSKIIKRDNRIFFSNMSYLATLTKTQIRGILADEKYNFVSKIREVPFLVSQRCIPRAELSNIQLLSPLTQEKVAVVDSGIYNPLIVRTRVHHLNYLKANQTPDEDHGTFVSSKILFGTDVFAQVSSGGVHPSGKILDVQVMYLENNRTRVNPEVLQTAILEVVTRYSDVAIFNLSIAEDGPIKEGEISEITEFLDVIARAYDVIFVCAVGNQQIYPSHTYPQIFKQKEARIAAPSDALNVLSVGSISAVCTSDTICPNQNYPAPFTRVGGINGIKKPELVTDGGNIKKDPSGVYGDAHAISSVNQFGVEGINKSGLYKDIGTSLSAPLVSRECLFLLDYIKRTNISGHIRFDHNRANLIKALLIHSTSRVPQVQHTNEHFQFASGFGIPDYKAVLKDTVDSVSVIYADAINFVEKKHNIRINIPEEFLNKEVEMTLTLVYNPPVDKNYPNSYKMVQLDATLRLILPTFDADSTTVTGEKAKSITPKQSWEDYRHDSHSVIHYNKTRQKFGSQVLEILLQLSAERAYESKILGREEEEVQNYALILTITDKTGSGHFREQVLAINELEEIVENQVEIESES